MKTQNLQNYSTKDELLIDIILSAKIFALFHFLCGQ
jgi:hypothetical protein